jgi:hypothetical protein
MNTPVKVPYVKHTNTTLVAATWTKLVGVKDRDLLITPWNGTDFQVYFRRPDEAEPSGATDGVAVTTNFRGFWADYGAIPVIEVWAYSAGTPLIEVIEGSARQGVL